jgi:peptidase M23-like protein
MRRLVPIVLLLLVGLLGGAQPAGAWTWPVSGPLLERFSFDATHPYAAGQSRGIAIGAADGAAVLAPAAGVVSFAGTVPANGRTLTIQTADGLAVTLTHLGALAVARGAGVVEGSPVGAVGSSGTAEFPVPYVHLGIRVASDDQGYLDPLRLLPVAGPPAAPTSPVDPVAAPAPAPVAPSVSVPAVAVPSVPAPRVVAPPVVAPPVGVPEPVASPRATPVSAPVKAPAVAPVPAPSPAPAQAPAPRQRTAPVGATAPVVRAAAAPTAPSRPVDSAVPTPTPAGPVHVAPPAPGVPAARVGSGRGAAAPIVVAPAAAVPASTAVRRPAPAALRRAAGREGALDLRAAAASRSPHAAPRVEARVDGHAGRAARVLSPMPSSGAGRERAPLQAAATPNALASAGSMPGESRSPLSLALGACAALAALALALVLLRSRLPRLRERLLA